MSALLCLLRLFLCVWVDADVQFVTVTAVYMLLKGEKLHKASGFRKKYITVIIWDLLLETSYALSRC